LGLSQEAFFELADFFDSHITGLLGRPGSERITGNFCACVSWASPGKGGKANHRTGWSGGTGGYKGWSDGKGGYKGAKGDDDLRTVTWGPGSKGKGKTGWGKLTTGIRLSKGSSPVHVLGAGAGGEHQRMFGSKQVRGGLGMGVFFEKPPSTPSTPKEGAFNDIRRLTPTKRSSDARWFLPRTAPRQT
jgi:hypothetical protein